jgi:two-component system, NarL family, invasion response regulator UvrY
MMLHVALCDDHPLLREGLKRILLQQPDISVDVEAGSGGELLDKAAAVRLDVVILDISLPDMNGLDVLKNLHASGNRAAVLILSMHPEDHYAMRALKAGAAGYLQKESAPEEIVRAIRRVAQGRKYVTASLAERLAIELGDSDAKAPHEILSDREYQVLCLLAAGKGTKEIAGELSLSSPTVATYKSRILAKLGLTTTVELVRYAITHGLVE